MKFQQNLETTSKSKRFPDIPTVLNSSHLDNGICKW